mmetsp:Transcript_21855/g.59856  ORF Transcript_21855/g.59856 Transcript_21855/m.59856 type:complete len:163 (-) Transcript_21855:359-847(-)
MNEDNIFVWTATIFGPADTPWEGGIFSLRMTFCDQYPDKPPKVCFSLYIFLFSPLIGLGAGAVHDKGLSSQWWDYLIFFLCILLITIMLSVYQDGTLCLDIIQNKWSPSYTVSSVLTSIQSLLTDPNCGSPANPEAAELYLQDRKAYNRRVRRLTEESLGGA